MFDVLIQLPALTSPSPMERSAIVLIPLPDWKELWLLTAVILGMDCLVEQREHVSLTEHGVEGILIAKVQALWPSIADTSHTVC